MLYCYSLTSQVLTPAALSSCAFTGKEFFALPEETQLSLLRTGNKVFCRAEPRDKQRLIAMLSRLGASHHHLLSIVSGGLINIITRQARSPP
jgi:magnesium-transporting ATPase (P-type)